MLLIAPFRFPSIQGLCWGFFRLMCLFWLHIRHLTWLAAKSYNQSELLKVNCILTAQSNVQLCEVRCTIVCYEAAARSSMWCQTRDSNSPRFPNTGKSAVGVGHEKMGCFGRVFGEDLGYVRQEGVDPETVVHAGFYPLFEKPPHPFSFLRNMPPKYQGRPIGGLT